MARTPEGRVKDAVRKILNSYENVYHFSPATGGYGRSGVPDIVCCVNGQFLAIECKADFKKNGLTELQKKEMDAIRGANGVAYEIDGDTVKSLHWILRSTLKATPKESK